MTLEGILLLLKETSNLCSISYNYDELCVYDANTQCFLHCVLFIYLLGYLK